MKTLKTIFILALVASAFAACTPDFDKVLVDETGVWKVDKTTYEEFDNDVLIDSTREETLNDGTFTFNEDMTGLGIDAANDSSEFTWLYNSDAEILSMTFFSIITLPFDVVDYDKNSQTLRFETVDGTLREVNTIELSR